MVLNAVPVCLLTLCCLSCPVPRAQRDAQATREACAARAGLWGTSLNTAHSKQESERSRLCCVCLANTHKACSLGNHTGEKQGGEELGGGAGRLNLYDNPMGDCGRGVRAREMGLLTLPCSQWSHLVLLTGDLRACNVGAFSGPWLSAEKEESEQMYSRA